MTSLAELAGLTSSAPMPPASVELAEDHLEPAVLAASRALLERGDLYRYTGVKPNHKHAAISS
ncbi:hypothetical protein [Curtobacterium sp. MCLR17_039]|uniref:hypothetical protein n=1 Tax=Curtobacterium sp. MCLR17_039 TaxID=2175624 RepID=UPI0011B6450B|nr:hypothetical protein [Curtobacterium sp. MCLR17_039]